MIIDVECTNKACGQVRVDVLMKSSDPMPVCEKCGQPTERKWSVSLPGNEVSCNFGTLTVRSNFMED